MQPWIWGAGIAVLVLGAAYGARNQINGLLGHSGAQGVGGKPHIWWCIDDSQVNGRQWLDWENRATREPNEPYLKICQARATLLWGSHFQIEPIVGRVAALERLRAGGATIPEGVDRVPPALWVSWCRATFLKTFGGLWLDGSVLPIGAGQDLHYKLMKADVLTFGTDPDEGISDTKGVRAAAGVSAGWAAMPAHPVWAGMERDLASLITEGDQSWSAFEGRRSLRWLWDKHCSGVVGVDRAAEVSRDRYGRRLELDTLLGETDWPAGTRDSGLWVPLPDGRDGLERASPWLWFTRMSVEQIRESPFVWARWATKV
jgi:hypothetical protein